MSQKCERIVQKGQMGKNERTSSNGALFLRRADEVFQKVHFRFTLVPLHPFFFSLPAYIFISSFCSFHVAIC